MLCDIIRALITSLVWLIRRGQAFIVMSFKHRDGKPRASVKHYWKCSRQCHVSCQTLLEHAWEQCWRVLSNAIENSADNRRFPEITGEDNLTVFSYSGRVKSPEWRRQPRRADLRHFEIFRHGPIIIYTRLPAGGTYCPICTFPASSECLIGISDAFSAFCLRVSVIFQRAYSALHPQAWT